MDLKKKKKLKGLGSLQPEEKHSKKEELVGRKKGKIFVRRWGGVRGGRCLV